jgi:hypothetical protein
VTHASANAYHETVRKVAATTRPASASNEPSSSARWRQRRMRMRRGVDDEVVVLDSQGLVDVVAEHGAGQ